MPRKGADTDRWLALPPHTVEVTTPVRAARLVDTIRLPDPDSGPGGDVIYGELWEESALGGGGSNEADNSEAEGSGDGAGDAQSAVFRDATPEQLVTDDDLAELERQGALIRHDPGGV